MAIKAFLSSTRADLDQDCRPAAKDGIEHAGATAIAMETWVTPYSHPVEECQRKLQRDSTHYVGVFAYRYGSRVPDGSMSITQAEFSQAKACIDNQRIVVFVPDPKCQFAVTLKERAKDQPPEEAQKQHEFLEEIRMHGSYSVFTASHDLYRRVKTMVEQWGQGSLRETAAVTIVEYPSEAEIAELGRDEQVRQLCTSVAALLASGRPEVAAFLIHGNPGCGVSELGNRLRKEFERISGRVPVTEYRASVLPAWRNDGLKALLAVLGRQLRPGFSPPATVKEYARALVERLQTSNILLNISDVQRFENGQAGFAEYFWSPLAAEVATSKTPHALLCLVGHESMATPDCQTCAPLSKQNIATWKPDQFIHLKDLENFTEEELVIWLVSRIRKAAQSTARTLIEETGGEPIRIYSQIRDPRFWDSVNVLEECA
jgi:hypothetical protein